MSKTIKIISRISSVETIAEGHGIRELAQLREREITGVGVKLNQWGWIRLIFNKKPEPDKLL